MNRKRANIMQICAQPGDQRALKYDPAFCWAVRDMAQKGMMPEEWCAEIGVTMSTLYNWANTYPEFEEAVVIAWHVLNAYWTRTLRRVIENPILYDKIKANVLLEFVRKRFPETWGKNARNTQETFENRDRGTDEGGPSPLSDPNTLRDASIEELEARLARLRDRRAAESEPKEKQR